MSIWTYKYESTDRASVEAAVKNRNLNCRFCQTSMDRVYRKLNDNASRFVTNRPFVGSPEQYISCCPVCGWWVVRRDIHGRDNAGAYAFTNTYGAIGSLKELDLEKSSTPIDEVRAFLAARYEEGRKSVGPLIFEEVVASVYRSHGYNNVRVTGKTNDGGIDIIMEGPDDTLIGVQVKRYKNKIDAEQIRSFTGALMLKGLTQGIFLTTSDYTRGAQNTAIAAAEKGYRVKLINADAFYDALGIVQRTMYDDDLDPAAPYSSAQMHDIGYKLVYL